MDEPQYRLSRILTETYATPPSPGWRVEPPGNSNPRRTRQRFDSIRAPSPWRHPSHGQTLLIPLLPKKASRCLRTFPSHPRRPGSQGDSRRLPASQW